MGLKASISGIRGVIGTSLTPRVIVDYVSAFSSILSDGKVLLGRDSRVTGEMVSGIVKGTLNACGRDVVDIGIVPTPVVLFGVGNGNYAGGIVITASHNPEEWNALKLVNKSGKFISPREFDILSSNYSTQDFYFSDFKNIGTSSFDENIAEFHKKKIFDFIEIETIRKKKFVIALDTVNGAGGLTTVKFLKEAGCEIKELNTEPTGIFAHPPEPTPKNLKELSDTMKLSKFDAGFALDPDGDRLVIADENGDILSEELTLALCVDHYLKKYGKTDVVINLSSSKVTEDIAGKYGVKIFRVPTGEIHVTEEMEKTGSLIGGEGNGGVIALKLNKCRDALVGIAFILEMLSGTDKKLSEIVNELPKYFLVKEKFPASSIDFTEIENDIKNSFGKAKIDDRDGLRIELVDSWALIRKSNTEPIIRIFAEAQKEEKARELIEKIRLICKI
jgi:phosphomannomutase